MNASEAYGDFAWVYDAPLGKPFAEATRPALERLVNEYLGDRRGSVLDLACGTGLSSRLLRSLGFEVIGIDASLPMLSRARKRDVTVCAGDLRSLPTARTFPLVSCLYDSLNHMLDRDDLSNAMVEAARVLDEDGIFLFDMNQPGVYGALWDSAELFRHDADKRSMEIRTTFDESSGIATAMIRGSFRTSRGRFRFEEVRRQRAWTFEEIAHAAVLAGLTIDTRLDYDPFGQGRDAGIGVKWLMAAHR